MVSLPVTGGEEEVCAVIHWLFFYAFVFVVAELL